MRPIAALVVLLVVAAAAGGWLAWRSLDEPGPSTSDVRVEIPPGTPLSRVAGRLADAGVIRHPRLFEAWGRVSGRAARVRAGEYEFPARATPRDVMARLVSGHVVMHSVTLVEGWTFAQARRALLAHPALEGSPEELEGKAVMERLGKGGSPEGWFLPETYRFPRGTKAFDILRVAHRAMEQALEEAWADRAEGLPFETPYEALILASIIEKESALDAERGAIAGVFVRRLQKGMRLQTDPTVIYGLGDGFDGNLRRRDLESDGPFNTYMRSGLPPTPIALPGRGALRAAVQPAQGDALFFVATGEPDGSHAFSATLDEHNRAVQRYLKRLRSRAKP
jgi:UPF0755 protein